MTLFRSFFAILALLSTAGREALAAEESVVALTVSESDHGGGRIYVPVRFGNALGTMRLDTGASTSRLRLASWNAQFPVLARSESEAASGKTTHCEDVEAQNVQLVAEQGNNIGRAKYEVSRCETSAGDDLLGLDFFRDARFTLDLARGKMIFSGSAGGASASGGLAPLRLIGPERRLIGVDVRLGRTAAVGLLDTGAELSAVDRRFVEKHRSLFRLVREKSGAIDASGAQFAYRLYKLRELDLGEGRVLADVYMIAYDFGPLRQALGRETPFILGFNVVWPFVWTFDFSAPDAPRWRAEKR
jgi:hypothetical protein